MQKRNILPLFLMLCLPMLALAQRPGVRPGGQMMDKRAVYGKVVESLAQTPLEYVNIVLLDNEGKKQITGTVTDKTGYFELKRVRPGTYQLRFKFIGFEAYTIEAVQINPMQGEKNLGTIALDPAVLQSEGVSVEAEKQAIEFKIDKKVVNVAKHYTSASGTAVDVLENVPSVNVDAEGTVELRGSDNFQVLIDNRPTILDAQDALKQIPASTIENIEIITNPSAKYDPDGTAGIMNIVTKTKELNGTSAIVNSSVGSFGRKSVDGTLSYRTKKYTAMVGFDYNERPRPGSSIARSATTIGDTTYYNESKGDRDGEFNSYSFKAGLDYYLTEKDVLTAGLRYGSMDMEFGSSSTYKEWTVPGSNELNSTTTSLMERGGNFLSVNLDYLHQFDTKGHELKAQAIVQQRDGEEESFDKQFDGNMTQISGTRATEDGPHRPWRFKVDYTLPFNEESKFEAGYQSRLGSSEDKSETEFYNPETGEYDFDPLYAHSVDYKNHIHSLYSLYAGTAGAFGYQGGLRAEYTNREITDVGVDDAVKIDRWDLFPTMHISYGDPKGEQVMASYARRIRRPRGWAFEPFLTWMDAYNVRRGNPNLLPQFIDSYELGYMKMFGKHMLSFEAFHKVTHNKIERVRSVYDANIFLHTTENVGQDYSTGAELMINLRPTQIWTLNLIGTAYRYRVEGSLYDQNFDREDDTWGARFNNTLKLTSGTRFQINGSYRGASVSAQGNREASWGVNLALRQEMLNRKLSATVQVRDVFQTFNREQTYSGNGFESYSKHERKSPSYSLTLTYNFNNYKVERGGNGENGEYSGEGGEGEF